MNKRMRKMAWMVPAGIVGMAVFIAIGGTVVMLLWNWLAPMLFGLPLITFWQSIGLLALGRILFGGFGLGGGGHRCHSRGRIRERMDERWEKMTAEERERMRQGLYDRGGETTPLDPNPTA